MWNDRYSGEGLNLFGRARFDPVTAIAGTGLALSAVSAYTSYSGGKTSAAGQEVAAEGAETGAKISAAGQLASGDYALASAKLSKAESDWEAEQLEAQEGSVIGAAQRTGLDTRLKAAMLSSTARAGASAGGVDSDVGTSADVQKAIETRGEYAALMDMWQGRSTAQGMESKATGYRLSGMLTEAGGEQSYYAARLNALSTLASGTSTAAGYRIGAQASTIGGYSSSLSSLASGVQNYAALKYQTKSGSTQAA